MFQFSYRAMWSRKIFQEIARMLLTEQIQQLLLLVSRAFTPKIRFNAQIV